MGGFFSPQQTPPQVIDPTPQAMWPFREEFVRAVSNLLFNPPGYNLTPLEEEAILRAGGLAPGVTQTAYETAMGGYLPGTGRENPFVQNLIQAVEAQGEIARRQLAAAAQRAGMFSSTDYLQQLAGLEAGLAQKRGEVLANVWEAERARQMQALPMVPGLSGAFTDLFGRGREARVRAIQWPFELGAGLLGGARAVVQPGETRPSPFASLLGALAPFAPIFVKV